MLGFQMISRFMIRRQFVTDYDQMFVLLDDDMQNPLRAFFDDYHQQFMGAWGSRSKHHARPGGLRHHLLQMATIYRFHHMFFHIFGSEKKYSLSDGMVFILLHDLEKLLRYSSQDDLDEYVREYDSHPENLLKRIVSEYCIPLRPMHWEALKYAHGEGKDYDPYRRVMSAFGSLCHCADTLSARIGHDLDEHFREVA